MAAVLQVVISLIFLSLCWPVSSLQSCSKNCQTRDQREARQCNCYFLSVGKLISHFSNSQDFSRSNNVDFIDLHFKSEVLSPGEENIPAGAVLIPGLNILGGVWDPEGGRLTDLSPDSPTINKYLSLSLTQLSNLSLSIRQDAASGDQTQPGGA